jgi:hypothetical protein
VLTAGDRLILTNNKPSLYDNDQAGGTPLGNPIGADARGLVEFYTPETRFDMIVAGTGVTTQVHENNEGGWQRGGVAWVNVKDYSTFQAAFNALSSSVGGVIYVPAGDYNQTTTPSFSPIVWTGGGAQLGLKIIGDGQRKSAIGYTADNNSDMFTFNTTNFLEISDIQIAGSGAAGTGRGIVLNGCFFSTIKDVWINGMHSWGIETRYDAAVDNVINNFENVIVWSCGSNGAVKLTAHTWKPVFTNCTFGPSNGYCVYLDGCNQPQFMGCTFEHQNDTVPYVYVNGVRGVHIDRGWFEADLMVTQPPPAWFIEFAATGYNYGHRISNCHFVRTSPLITSLRAIKFNGNAHANLENLVGVLANGVAAPTGLDDIVTNGDIIKIIGDCRIADDTYSWGAPFRISCTAIQSYNIQRAASDWRFKFFAVDSGTRNALKDPFVGDIVHNADNTLPQIRTADATALKWLSLGVFFGTAAERDALSWTRGDAAYRTDGGAGVAGLYICTVAGSPGTWQRIGGP